MELARSLRMLLGASSKEMVLVAREFSVDRRVQELQVLEDIAIRFF